MHLTQSTTPPAALVPPLDDNQRLVELIAAVTEQPQESVRQRLYDEEMYPSINVRRSLQSWGLPPYVWSEQLARFYTESDAYLYDSAVWNRNPIKLQMRTWIGQYLDRQFTAPLKILCLGDGVGFDSVYLAQLGHQVTYFEVPGYSYELGRRVIQAAGVSVQVLMDAALIPLAAYDIVVCLDVLEHLPDPAAFLATIKSYLCPTGCAIIHAPFYVPDNFTHLKINRKYSGRLSLFRRQGFVLIDGQIGWNPLVFAQADALPRSTSLTHHLYRLALRLMGIYIAIGELLWGHPFLLITLINRRPNPAYLAGLRDC